MLALFLLGDVWSNYEDVDPAYLTWFGTLMVQYGVVPHLVMLVMAGPPAVFLRVEAQGNLTLAVVVLFWAAVGALVSNYYGRGPDPRG